MSSFDKARKFTLQIEGDYSDDPRDSGGQTRYGITKARAMEFGYTGEMRELPLELAKHIYKVSYWDVISLDNVAALSEPIALELFDTGVNCGPGTASRFLQRLLNAFNREQNDYADIRIDGLIGHNTIGALRAFLTRRGNLGSDVMVEALNSLQGAYYVDLAERRPKDEAFMFGWFVNRVLKRAK